jgi:hypothetical protein
MEDWEEGQPPPECRKRWPGVYQGDDPRQAGTGYHEARIPEGDLEGRAATRGEQRGKPDGGRHPQIRGPSGSSERGGRKRSAGSGQRTDQPARRVPWPQKKIKSREQVQKPQAELRSVTQEIQDMSITSTILDESEEEKSHGSRCLPTRGDEDPPPAYHRRGVVPGERNTATQQPESSEDRAHYFAYDGRGSKRRHLFTLVGTRLQSVGQLLTKVRCMLGQEGAGVELQVGRTRHCSPDRQALPKGDHMDVTVWAPSLMGGGGHGERHRQKQKLGRNPPQTKVSGGRRAKARM